MEAKADSDPEFGSALAEAHREYSEEREADLVDQGGPVPTGGVGGARAGVKCLHAHYAHRRAGRDNPVGDLVRDWIEPLDCTEMCVVDGARNPAWSGGA